jgi:hypothetical protein
MAMISTPSKLASIVAGAALVLALCFASAAQAESEPNDSFETANGPLVSGAAYGGVLENDADVDTYFFYVTRASSQVNFTIDDPTVDGGGVYVELDDSQGMGIDNVDVFAEDFDTLEETLDPGKYYLSLETEEFDQFDEAYAINISGPGASSLGSYAATQAQCRTATTDTSKAQSALEKAKRRLRRALKNGSSRRKAKARHAVKVARAKLRAASAEQKLVCSIPA